MRPEWIMEIRTYGRGCEVIEWMALRRPTNTQVAQAITLSIRLLPSGRSELAGAGCASEYSGSG